MKKVSVSVFGEKMQEQVFGMSNKEMELAMLFVHMAIRRGDSVSIDVVECKDAPTPEYLKDYVSI